MLPMCQRPDVSTKHNCTEFTVNIETLYKAIVRLADHNKPASEQASACVTATQNGDPVARPQSDRFVYAL